MKTLGRNSNNDLYLEGGQLAVLHDIDAQIQIIEATLLTQQGELQFDEEGGIDYFGTVLMNPTYIEFWAGLVRSRIEALPFVNVIDTFTYNFDKQKNTLFWSMIIENTDGEKVSITDRQTTFNEKPNVDIKWDNIYDKPEGTTDSIELLEGMQYEAESLQKALNPSTSTFRDTKNTLNRILYGPTDKEYQRKCSIQFNFVGVPVGAGINFSNLLVDIANNAAPGEQEHYSPFIVEISDGTHLKSDTTEEPKAENNKIVFLDSHGNRTQIHSIAKGGNISITIRGNISAIKSASALEDNGTHLPILTDTDGTEPFAFLTDVIVGEQVPLSFIGDDSFYGMSNLNNIEWDDSSVDDIKFGKNAFKNCSSISDLLWIPKKVSSVGEGCFCGCKNIKSLSGFENVANAVEATPPEEQVGYKVPDECFKGCSQLKSINFLYSQTTKIGSSAFEGCTSIATLDGLPDTIVEFGDSAFKGCSGIEKILYPPSSLETIGTGCFSGCRTLDSVYLPESLTTIGDFAFSECESLKDVLCEASVVPTISENTFDERDDDNRVSVYVPQSLVSSYKANQFWNKCDIEKFGIVQLSLENIEKGETLLGSTSLITSNSIWIAEYNDGATKYRYAKNKTMLPEYTYSESKAETVITLKGAIRRISAASMTKYPLLSLEEEGTFSKLTDIRITDTPLEFIGDYAFAKCTSLRTIEVNYHDSENVLHDGFENPYCIGARTFWMCESLTSTSWLSEGLGELEGYDAFGEGCFHGAGITSLDYAADSVTKVPAYCFAETKIKDGLGSIGNQALTELGEYCFYGCDALESIEELKNSSVTRIPDYCFSGCTELTSIDGIQNIYSKIEIINGKEVDNRSGAHIFEGCSKLEDISDLSDASQITDLPDYAFSKCTSLSQLSGLSNINSLGEYCFSGCSNLHDISGLYKEQIENEEPPTQITKIPKYCFSECSGLKTLIGCWAIEIIEECAFSNCTGLLSITGIGENIVIIGQNAFQNCTGLLYVSTMASTVPNIQENTFNGVQVANIPLYVKEDLIASFSNAIGWSSFTTKVARTIKVSFDNIQEITNEDLQCVKVVSRIGNTDIRGMWFVDFGDGEGFRHFYASANESDGITGIDSITYEDVENRTITFCGDITEIRSGDYVYTPDSNSDNEPAPSFLGISPFLGSCSQKAISVNVNSSYLQSIGAYCFCNYGESPFGGNYNELTVSLAMARNAKIGACAFAKSSELWQYGPIGEISTCTASELGDFAFFRSGLTSISAFTSLASAGIGAFAYNQKISSISSLGNLAEVPKWLFYNCNHIEKIENLSSTTSIGEEAFYGCVDLTTVNGLSGNLISIGDNAFGGCNNIYRIFVSCEEPPALPFNGFTDTVYQNAIVYVPAGLEQKYKEEPYWTRFVSDGRDNAIRTRAIEFSLLNVNQGDKIASGMGIVSATGTWTISYDDGEGSIRTFGAGETTLPSYTFKNGAQRKTIKISGPITGIRCSEDAYPILAQNKGTNTWLESVEGSDVLDISEIGDYTFSGCSNLKSITHLPTVEKIGERAFENDTSLFDILGLTGVTSIASYAFSGCSSLKDLFGLHSVKEIGERAFNGCSSLTVIDGLGINVTSIGEYAFASCPLKEVQMFATTPPSIFTTSFEGIDFATIPLFVRAHLVDTYKDSSWNIFSNIRSRHIEFTLKDCPANITIMDGIGKVESNTYWVVDWDSSNCNGTPCISGLATYLPEHTYAISGNHSFRIEGDITGIGVAGEPIDESTTEESSVGTDELSFVIMSVDGSTTDQSGKTYVSKHLSSVYSSDDSNITTIGDLTFLRNTALTSVNLRTLTRIGYAAFAEDTSLTSTDFLQNVVYIGDYAFFGCSGLEEVSSLNSVAEIGSYAFYGLNSLKSVQCGIPVNNEGKIPIKLGEKPFGEINSLSNVYLYVPMDSVDFYRIESPWKYFNVASQTIEFTMTNIPSGTTFSGISGNDSVGNAKVVSSGAWTIDWGDGTREKIPETQSSFSEHTYTYDRKVNYPNTIKWSSRIVDGLTVWFVDSVTVSINGNFTEIGTQSPIKYPFLAVQGKTENEYLKSVVASPSLRSLKKIGDNAFHGCKELTQISGFINVESIGDYAFAGCSSLVNLGDETNCFTSATQLGVSAFEGCVGIANLKAFPNVLKIGTKSFSGCTGLTSTSGLGANYSGVPYYTVYNPDLRLPEDSTIPSEWDWITEDKNIYTLEDIGATEITSGWKVFKQLEIDYNARKIIRIEWETNPNLEASFGTLVFDGCYFSSINMEAFEAPPIIQTSTFTVNPSATVVYVPSATEFVDPVQLYSQAPGWKAFFNIVASSSISFTFEYGSLHGPHRENNSNPDETGTGIRGFGNVIFTGNNFSIDWGDGSEEQKVVGDGQSTLYTAKFPDHAYPEGFDPTGPVIIKIRGNITGITGVTIDNEHKPILAVCKWSRTYSRNEITNEDYVSSIEPIDIDYSKLLNVTVGSNARISMIGEYCFYECIGLKEAVIKKPTSGSASLSTIGTSAFSGCNSLEKFDNEIGMEIGATIGNRAFYNCSNLQNIDFITGVSYIGESAFEGCSNQQLSSLTSETVTGHKVGLVSATSLGVRAFYGCSGLTSISLPDTLTKVSRSAFEGCTRVRKISWDYSETLKDDSTIEVEIGDRAFYGCSNPNGIYDVTIPAQVRKIGKSAFYGCGMTSFTWGDSEHSGSGNYSLSTDELSVGEPGIFEGSINLSRVRIYNSIDTMPARAFCNCSSLTSITISGITTIRPYAFFGCSSLAGDNKNTNPQFIDSFSNIVSSVTGKIGDYAFARCFSLHNITIPYNVTSLGEGCFSRSDYGFYVGDNWCGNNANTEIPRFYTISDFESWMTTQYGQQRVDVWSIYDSIITNQNTPQHNGLNVTWGRSENGNWIVPQSATIGTACFMNCVDSDIVWEQFPNVPQVPAYCFYNCSNLFKGNRSIYQLPDTISYFGRFALAKTGIASLSRVKTDSNGDIVLDNNDVPVFANPISASLSPALFYGCTDLTSLGNDITVSPSGGGQSISYPDGIVRLFSTIPSELPDACFYGCSALSNIDSLGRDLKSVTRIGKYCFAKCTSLTAGIESGNITSAMENVLQIGDGCFMGCTGLTGEFYGLPKVTYYPYKSFYGCSQMSAIMALYSYYDNDGESPSGNSELSGISGIPDVQVTLEGDSFGGIQSITDITLPYTTNMVKVVSASGSADPFSGLTASEKATTRLWIPNEIVSSYSVNTYWKQFLIETSYQGMPLALEISMDVSNEPDVQGEDNTNKRRLFGYGRIGVDTSKRMEIAIEWEPGKGTLPLEVPVDGYFDLSQLSYQYDHIENASLTRPVTMKIYGNVTSIEGAADDTTSSVIANKTVVPFFYTHVTAYKNPTTPRLAENTWFRSVLFHTPLITEIGRGCFGYCIQMLPPMIPTTVTKIGNNAFFGCSQITNFNFVPADNNVSILGQYCFAYCDYITDYSKFKNFSNISAIPAGCFARTKSVPTDDVLDWIPDSVTEIGFAAFQHVCFSHFKLQTNTSITIRNYAFRYNNSLVDFTDGTNANPVVSGIKMKLIGTNAFRDCAALSSLNGLLLDSSVTSIPVGTFRECTSLSDINALSSYSAIVAIEDGAFYKTSITAAGLGHLPRNLTRIGTYPAPADDGTFESQRGGAFAYCTHLQTLHGLPTTMISLGRCAFKGCSELIDIGFGTGANRGMPSSLELIGPNCFIGCHNIANLELKRFYEPDGITELGDYIQNGTLVDAVFEYDTYNHKANFIITTPSGSDEAYKNVWAPVSQDGSGHTWYPRFYPTRINPD